jgi:hypothetical protein
MARQSAEGRGMMGPGDICVSGGRGPGRAGIFDFSPDIRAGLRGAEESVWQLEIQHVSG